MLKILVDSAPGWNPVSVGRRWFCDSSLWIWFRVRDHPVAGVSDARHAVQRRDRTSLEFVQHVYH